MRRIIGILVLSIATRCAAEGTLASQGAVVEGLFILQNKHLAVKQAIQSLKKEVSEPFQHKREAHFPRSLPYTSYHATLKQTLFPLYIDELAALAASMEKDVAILNGSQPITNEVLGDIMHRAFLANEKTETEKKLLMKIFEVDRLEHELDQSGSYPRIEGKRTSGDLTLSITQHKNEVAKLKSRLASINKELYVAPLKQQVFLEKILYRKK
jgi:hypothetical protein